MHWQTGLLRKKRDRRPARPHPGARHRSRARSSACSAWSRCTCRPPAAAPRARSCSRRSAPDGGRAAARGACAGGAAAAAEDAAPAPPERRLSRPRRAGRRAHRRPARRDPAGAGGRRPARFSSSSRTSERRGGVALAARTPSAAGSSRRRPAAWPPGRSRSLGVARRLRAASRSRATATGCGSGAGCCSAPRRRCRCARVHAVRVVEGVLRRPFGLAALRVEVAGYAEEAGRRAHAVPAAAARARSSRSWPSCCPSWPTTRAGSRRRRARAARRYVLPPALAGAGRRRRGRVARRSAPWPLLLAPLLGADGWLATAPRAGGCGRAAGDALAAARPVDPARARRAPQPHTIAQNPLQRRAGLADLAVAVGKGGHARVRHLEAATPARPGPRSR